MDKLIEQKAVREEKDDMEENRITEDINIAQYGEYKVVCTFSDTGESITDLLSAYIDRMASLKY